jgi:hypothetical protein
MGGVGESARHHAKAGLIRAIVREQPMRSVYRGWNHRAWLWLPERQGADERAVELGVFTALADGLLDPRYAAPASKADMKRCLLLLPLSRDKRTRCARFEDFRS